MGNRILKIAFVSLFYGLQNACCSAMYPLLDNQVMTLLAKHPLYSKELYGRQRLWGTVGHALSSILVGSICSESNGYRNMFVSNLVSTLCFILAVLLLVPKDSATPDPPVNNPHPTLSDSKGGKRPESVVLPIGDKKVPLEETNQPCSSSSSLEAGQAASEDDPKKSAPQFLTLLKDPSFTFFLLVIFVTGVAKHILSIFSALFVWARYGMSESKVGISQGAPAFPEMLLFYFGKQINKAIGLHWMLIIAQLATIFRVLAFAFIPREWDWAAYVIEAFKGVSTSLLIMSGVRLSHELAPPGLEATAQGAFVAVFQGLATAVSGVANFLVPSKQDLEQHAVDPEKLMLLFKYTGYISLAAVILLAMKWAYVDRVICVRRK
jgi:Na+/melibiose symporter-like transporter